MILLEALGLLAGAINCYSTIPQIVLNVKEPEKRAGVSIQRQALIIASNAIWLYYGVQLSLSALAITAAINVLLNSIIITQCFYRDTRMKIPIR